MHHCTDLAESFLKMYSFAMLRSAGQKLYEIFLWCSLFRGVHYIRINRYISKGALRPPLPARSLACSLQYGRVVPLCAPHVDVARGDRLGSVEGTHTEPPGPIPVSKKGGGGR
mgnify:CR=1 FL=1